MFAIKGRTIILYETEEAGEDDFGQPIMVENPVEVANVIIEPASNDAIVSELEVNGKHIAYVLHIPKNDNHDWQDKTVEFYDEKWKTYGDIQIYDVDMTPLSWNKKVKVERYE